MRLAFAGTPEFSVHALNALHDAGHEIAGVFTQPDRPAGRGQKLTPSPVALRAVELGLPVFKPEKLRTPEQQALVSALQADLMVVVAYGLILPQAVLDMPAHGCLNIHASLLPRWRGAAPIQRAILAGDAETGVTIMRMEAGLDTGPMLMKQPVTIHAHTTAASLHDVLAEVGANLIVKTLVDLSALNAQVQPDAGVTYAAKLSKEEARVNWQDSAVQICRAVRAFNPFPVAWTTWNGDRIRLWAVQPLEGNGSAGVVVQADAEVLIVGCGEGLLKIQQLQFAGGRILNAADVLSGRNLHDACFV